MASYDERETLLEKVQSILKNISEKDLLYTADILSFIHDEELCQPYRKKARYMPYPWEFKNLRPQLLSEVSFSLKKIIDGKEIDLEIKNVPPFLYKELKEMEKLFPDMSADFISLDGKLTMTCSLDVYFKREQYILTCSKVVPLESSNIKFKKSSKRGKRGEPQSSMTMYLLYKHFKRIKLKRIYQTIATLCNEYSALFFKPVTGAPLSPENVRKRIQWTKKQKHLVEYAEKFEREKLPKTL